MKHGVPRPSCVANHQTQCSSRACVTSGGGVDAWARVVHAQVKVRGRARTVMAASALRRLHLRTARRPRAVDSITAITTATTTSVMATGRCRTGGKAEAPASARVVRRRGTETEVRQCPHGRARSNLQGHRYGSCGATHPPDFSCCERPSRCPCCEGNYTRTPPPLILFCDCGISGFRCVLGSPSCLIIGVC